MEQQVLGGIAGQGELRHQQHVGAQAPGALGGVDYALRVAGDVTDKAVDLAQRDAQAAHAFRPSGAAGAGSGRAA